jgi:peptidoglycan lytic transglycosylase A
MILARSHAMRVLTRGFLIITALALVTSGAGAKPAAKSKPAAPRPPVLKIAGSQIEPLALGDIDGWAADDHAAAFAAFLVSCKAILKSSPKIRASRPLMYRALYDVCRRAAEVKAPDNAKARAFFEENFRGLRISPLGDPNGFITGYYEPIAEGARFPSDEYKVPLYRRPSNLLVARLRRQAGPKGKAAWRKGKARVAPFYDRAQIEDGVLAGRQLEICYLKDPIDAFFAEIQGSARIRLEDGSILRLNYDAANGHPYTAVGRFLIERGIVPKEEMTMQRIRQWMDANPEEGRLLRRQNKSVVFFRETSLAAHEEPPGAQGVPLTAGRSIAVDKRLHVYGTPFFIDAELPIASDKPDTKFRRLMIAQDTGGAIVGPARADIYFGTGADAEIVAGRLRHYGRFILLVPKEIDPVAAARKLPLPPEAPADKEAEKLAALNGEKAPESSLNGAAIDAAIPLPKPRPARKQ